jgi:PmbA protein
MILLPDNTQTWIRTLFNALKEKESAEILLRSFQIQSTRFAENAITQNVSQGKAQHSIRLLHEGRQARLQMNHLELHKIPQLMQELRERIQVAPPDPEFMPLSRQHLRENPHSGFSESTQNHSPEQRADEIQTMVAAIEKAHFQGAGSYTAEAGHCLYANSEGVLGQYQKTVGALDVTMRSVEEGSEGSSLIYHQDISQIPYLKVVEETIETTQKMKKAQGLPPGDYPVVLYPAAVGDLVFFLTRLCFSTLPIQEGTAFLSQRPLGTRLFSEKLFLEENAFHPELAGIPFDGEGITKQKRTLVTAGIPQELVYDQRSARRAGVASTGHSLPQPNECGPLPMDMVMRGGTSSLEEMIASTEKGLLIRRFHYTNTLNPLELTITGMTRAGVFLD